MPGEHEHVKILKEIAEQFQPLFEKSPEGVYVYIDEVHKICSKRFADMFGLTVSEWEGMEGFINKHVAQADVEGFVNAFHKHVHQELTPTRIQFTGLRKDGSSFRAELDMIPFPWRGEMLALHFVRLAK